MEKYDILIVGASTTGCWFAEKMAKRVLGSTSANMTFDDTLNCLKDKIKLLYPLKMQKKL